MQRSIRSPQAAAGGAGDPQAGGVAAVAAQRGAALRRRVRPNQVVPFLTLALLIVVFAPSDNFLTVANLNSVINAAPVLLIVAAGATFPILAGSIDLSVAGVITLSGAVAAVLVPDVGEIALLLAAVVGLVVGLLNGAIVALGRLPSFLVTLGTLFIANGLAVVVLGGVPVSYVGEVGSSLTNNAVAIGALEIPYLAFVAFACVAVATVVAVRTRWGRAIYAIGGNEAVARLAGVDVTRYKILAFALSGLFAGIGGMVLTMGASGASPSMGESFLLTAIAAVVVGGTSLLGGIGGPQWTVLGALVLLVLDDGMVIAGIDPNYQTVIRGAVIIVAAALTLRRTGGVVK